MVRGRDEVRRGLAASIPLILGAVPFGLLCGTVARESGLGLLETALLSALVNAGSAQLVGVGMLAAGTAWPLVVLTTLVVNARHLFYSAALSSYVKELSPGRRAVLAFGLTDAVYALAAKRYRRDSGDGADGSDRDDVAPAPAHAYVLTVAVVVYAAWVGATVAALLYGGELRSLDGLGLDFAVCATYIGLVVATFTHARAVAVGLLSGALALALHQLPYQAGLFVATLVAVASAGLRPGAVRARGSGR